MNAEIFNGLIQQMSRLALHQWALLRKRLDEVDGQAQGLAVIESQNKTYFLESRKGCRKLDRPVTDVVAKPQNAGYRTIRYAFWWPASAPDRPWTGSRKPHKGAKPN